MANKHNEKPRYYVEYHKRRYEIRFERDCTRRCAFVKNGPYGPCEDACYLPDWFRRGLIAFDRAYLVKEEVDDGE